MTTTDDPILRELSDADPAIGRGDADAGEADRVLRAVLSEDAPRRRRSQPTRRPWPTAALGAASVLVVAAVVVIVVAAGHRGGSSAAPATGHSVTLIYRLQPTPEVPKLTGAAIDHELAVIRGRLREQPVHSQVTRIGADKVSVALSSSHLTAAAAAQIELRIRSSDSLALYDWEANSMVPGGGTVASLLPGHNAAAFTISQGTASAAPGTADAGGVTLYQAVRLASTQPAAPASARLSRLGAQYYAFGTPGSRACATAAADRGTAPLAGDHCYLAGPASTRSELESKLPRGVTAPGGTVLRLPQGIVVLQASNQTGIGVGAPAARFFVLRDRVGVSGAQIIDPRVSSDGGYPSVEFAFTPVGRRAFQSVTATIAHRGQTVSSGTTHVFQHFAAELNGRLLAVPQIDFEKYPSGVIESARLNEAAITTVSRQQARQIVTRLRLGTLPLALDLIGQRG
jgi:hypothetical protein